MLHTLLCFVLCLCVLAHADKPVRNVRVRVWGDKEYKISNVSTVGELQLRIQQKTGIDPLKQGKVVFGKRILSPLDSLRNVGVKSGSNLQVQSSKHNSKTVKSKERLSRLAEFAEGHLSRVEFRMSIDYLWDVLEALQRIINSIEFQEYMADPKELLNEAEKLRKILTTDVDMDDLFEIQGLPNTDAFLNQFHQALNSQSSWRSFVLKHVEGLRNLDLNGPLMSRVKQELRKAFDEGVDLLNHDSDFREYIKEEDPSFYDFLQENLDDFSDSKD